MNFITPSGKPWVEPTTKATKKARPAPDSYHKGFKVAGFPPGAMEEAQRLAEDDLRRWNSMTDADRAKDLTSGIHPPKPWNEIEWVKSAKKSFIQKGRSTMAFSIASAAEQCAEMSRKAGWLYVEIIPMKRGKEPNAQS